MSDNSVTIESLTSDNAQLRSELDTLKAKIQQKEQQDRNDIAATAAKAQAQTQNKLIQFQKPTDGYAPPKPEDECAARKFFGRESDARLANNLAKSNFGEYKRLRQVAVDLQLLG
jgi:hypothetical protein